jgi:hypothetical protein
MLLLEFQCKYSIIFRQKNNTFAKIGDEAGRLNPV